MSFRARVLPSLALASLGIACGGARADLPAGEADAAIDGGHVVVGDADASRAADAASPDAADGSGASPCVPPIEDLTVCNAVPDAPTTITSTCSITSAPPATGGKVEDGTYVLDSMTYFGTCPTTPDVEADSWTICGSV